VRIRGWTGEKERLDSQQKRLDIKQTKLDSEQERVTVSRRG
jgi:hypothetical protein